VKNQKFSKLNVLRVYVVVPYYNEELILGETAKVLIEKLTTLILNKKIKKSSSVLFTDDGSSDKTWQILEKLNKKNSFIKALKLAGNSGHQRALLAGLLESKKNEVDCAISMDADLQDDVGVLDQFINLYCAGNHIVYGVRKRREKDALLKKFSAQFFYRLMELMGVKIIKDHADYRLTSKIVLDNLELFGKSNLFLHGIFPSIGFKSEVVYYDRKERVAGKTKYPLKKMLSFALDGITSFSIVPLRIVTAVGFIVSFLSCVMALYTFLRQPYSSRLSINYSPDIFYRRS
jgi:glycosyltransferase involved in cell wall biosynthesis